jgi:hypothetical protein
VLLAIFCPLLFKHTLSSLFVWSRGKIRIREANPLFCVSCGTANPDQAVFCFACGTKIASEASSITKPETPSVLPAATAAPLDVLPYRWGRFQGLLCLTVGIVTPVVAVAILLGGDTPDLRISSLAILSPLLIFSGYSFRWRRRFSLALTYVWIALIAVIFILGSVGALMNATLAAEEKGGQIAANFVDSIPGFILWIPSSMYYRKRQAEFK